nr:13957_t:CDS:2 [Entrophospora candida]CAG8600951.1 8118_t:CDS:2 [Entrophospora candida]
MLDKIDKASESFEEVTTTPTTTTPIATTQTTTIEKNTSDGEDNENCLKHPKNQAKLTKVTERINREHGAITLYRDPMIESLHRVFNRYAQEHPEVLEDDFGVGYEDAREWHLVSDCGKNLDNSAHSILSVETLTTADPANNNISQNLR